MTTTSAPLFGERTTPQRRVPFRLMSYGSQGEGTEHQFTARAEIDAGTILAATSSNTDNQDAGFIQRFLVRVLVDDDGVPQLTQPEPVTDDEPADVLEQDDDEEDDEASAELVVQEPLVHTGDWAIDGKTFPTRALAVQHANEHGSSLRRFARLMDDPFQAVFLDALRQIFQYVVEQSGQRPTKPSSPSQRRPTQKRR